MLKYFNHMIELAYNLIEVRVVLLNNDGSKIINPFCFHLDRIKIIRPIISVLPKPTNEESVSKSLLAITGFAKIEKNLWITPKEILY